MKLMRTREGVPTLTPIFEFGGLENRLRRLFDEPFELTSFSKVLTPAVEISEVENEYVVTAELPGMGKDDVEIEYENGVLFLRGEKNQQTEEKKHNLLVWERTYGSFQRSFMLPKTIDQERIRAEFKDGILTVLLPKTEAAKSKKIEIAGEITK
jgi:HSP20 family protein